MRTPVRTEFPRRVRVISHVWIPMSDGCRLAARIWLPEDAGDDPVPAVMEYVPYRKNDGLVLRDAPIHAYFAGSGYASVRVDTRGSGDSDGILEDEYLPLEQTDGVEVIKWLAAQPWCTGKVGIIGKSWGGFNGLQIAALAPPELGAVISVASTDDRYADDVHYMGGCMLASNMLQWASVMLAYNARPPDPAVVGDSWREIWLDRMERTPPFVEAWVSHQRRDEFWKQGSVCEDYSAITCPVYMVGGWTDAYRNAILRFLEGYPGPCKGLIGPWAHVYPESGAPGPAIGFLQEAVRWWDCHLKGIENGIMDEPKLRAYMADSIRSEPGRTYWPGRWLATEGWPASEVETRTYGLSGGGKLSGSGTPDGGTPAGAGPPDGAAGPERELTIRGAQAPGADPGTWGGHGGPVDNPSDQRPEDGQSLCFDTEVLTEPVEILGFPRRPPGGVVGSPDRPRRGAPVRRLAGRRVEPHHARSAQSHAPGRRRGAGGPGARPALRRRGEAQLDRVLGPAGPPSPPGGLAHLLAVGMAFTGARPAQLVRRRVVGARAPGLDRWSRGAPSTSALRRARGGAGAASRSERRRGRRPCHSPRRGERFGRHRGRR